MAEAAWKATERQIARLLGGQRIPVTGRSRGDEPDVRHPWLSIECKQRRQLPAWLKEALLQAKAAATRDQLPIVVLHEQGARYTGALVVLTLQDFWDWFGDDGNGKRWG